MGQCMSSPHSTIGDCGTQGQHQGISVGDRYTSSKERVTTLKDSKPSNSGNNGRECSSMTLEVRTYDTCSRMRKRIGVVAHAIHSMADVTIHSHPKTQKSIQKIFKAMEGNILFQGLSLSTRQALVDSMSPVHVECGETIIREGDLHGQEYYVVDMGVCKVMKRDENGQDIEVASSEPGSGFGEIAVMYESKRAATVIASSSVKLWKLERSIYQAIKLAFTKHVEQQKRIALDSVPLLASLPDETKSEMSDVMALEEFSEGEFVIRQDEEGDKFYIVDQGSLHVQVDGEFVAELAQGFYFGERALIHNDVRNASVVATSYTTCFSIDRQSFQQFFASLQHAWNFSLLRKVAVFVSLTDEQILKLAKEMKQVSFPTGTRIFNAGDEGDAFYIVEDGSCSIIDCRGNAITTCTKGQCFGEMALLHKAERKASVVAMDNVQLLKCGVSTFEKFLGDLKDLRYVWKTSALKKIPLFSKLDSGDLSYLCEHLQEKNFLEGDVIFKEGETGDSFFIILTGTCSITKLKTSAHGLMVQNLIATLGPGQYFGERAMLCDDPRSASVRATSAVAAMVLYRKDFLGCSTSIQEDLSIKIGKIDAQKQDTILPMKLRRRDFSLIRDLGHGAFGKVYLVRCKVNNTKYALKCIKKERVIASKLTEHVIREREIMEHVQSPFLVSLANSFQDGTNLYMLMQLVEGGELFNYLTERISPLSENEAKFYAGCVILGLEYLNERGVAWRDLKPENILLDISGYAMLTDFGFAKLIPRGSKSFTMCGTPEYLAPEIILQTGHSFPVDWWALGVLVYEMVAGKPPFCHEDRIALFRSITTVSYTIPEHFSHELKDFISKMLVKIPGKRLGCFGSGARAVKEHPWFDGFDWDALMNRDMKPPYIPPSTITQERSKETKSSSFFLTVPKISYGQYDRAFDGF